ncbi:CsgE family curli-type amyloid fiber assembly protein [Algoriphagus sediminis]|uniref:Curli production assembly/transport component CsgE n=1 Tax=Algoriphagus sediminis TaxID=3057113 RepID=A0ABT7Y8E0_9BACT|nr:CsgE family curli-type amyloid fiber assembly protein [Algoriphagus sediminis]MDN3202736.1 CsgE family curli-type amyloid fiber assembly protein [Algoriphagus sediminis]
MPASRFTSRMFQARFTLVFISFMIIRLDAFSQTERVNVKADTTKVQADTTKLQKEAPDELKALLESITQTVVKPKKVDVELEIDGLVIDQTKTKSGREFYDLFFRDWNPPQGANNYSIFIVEKPFRLNQTFIEISINETRVYQSFLQPRYDFIENMAKESIASTAYYLAQYEEILRQLGGEDTSGTGIY